MRGIGIGIRHVAWILCGNRAGERLPLIMKNNINTIAECFVATDTAAIRDDVRRLGGIEAAAEYSADMASCQPEWEALASDDGQVALAAAIRDLVE